MHTPSPYGPTHQNYHAKLFNNRTVSQLYIDGENYFPIRFSKKQPLQLGSVWASQKRNPLRGSAQFDSKPRTKPVGTHFKHPVVTASSSLSFIRFHQTPIWGFFFPFFPAVKLRDPMHTAKKAFFYVCTIYTIQITIMAELKDS